MVWQGVWCDFGLILCKNSLKLHKNKNFCISDFSKNLKFLTNLANILNFICQICKFFKQSSPTSQPTVAHRFIKILKSHTSICKTKSTPFLACTCLFVLYKSVARIPRFSAIRTPAYCRCLGDDFHAWDEEQERAAFTDRSVLCRTWLFVWAVLTQLFAI